MGDKTASQKVVSTKNVFLFKSPKENEPDKFVEVLEKANLHCANIPVLSFRFVNQEALKTNLSTIHLFSAIIFTSVRAVEAVSNLLKGMRNAAEISAIQSFAVGHTTVEAAKKAGFDPKGEESGSAHALGEYIIQKVSNEDNRPFLYPCSNLHRDTLKELLISHGKDITEIISYETCPNERLKEAVEIAVQNQGLPDYAVFFSPSGFQFTLDAIDKTVFPLDKVKIIAIGPTTEKAICDHRFSTFATAWKPEPHSLLQALLKDIDC